MGINLVLRFVLEIGALISLGYWGFHFGSWHRFENYYRCAAIGCSDLGNIWIASYIISC